MATKAWEIGGTFAYLFLVTVILSLMGGWFGVGSMDILPVDSPSITADSQDFRDNTTMPTEYTITAGGWSFDANGLTANGSGVNTIFFRKNLGSIVATDEVTVKNPSGAPFKVYSYRTAVLWLIPSYQYYLFGESNITKWGSSTFGDVMGRSWPYPTGASNKDVTVKLTGTETTWSLDVNGEPIDSTNSLGATRAAIFTTTYLHGIETTGPGLSLATYYSLDETHTDLLTSTGNFMAGLLYVLVLTLPPWLFADPIGFWVMLVVNVVFVKIALIRLLIMVAEFWRGF